MKHYELKFEFQHLRFLGVDSKLSENCLGYFYQPKQKKLIQFNILDNLKVIRLYSGLVHHIGLTSRHEKFLKVYCLFELLGGKPDTSWRAIRVSISHSPKKVTDKKLVNYLLENFGELDISFRNYRQNKLFYDVFTELVEATYSEILKLLNNPMNVQSDAGQEIIKILDTLKSKHNKRRNRLTAYWDNDFESKLEKYIPYRVSAGRIRYVIGDYSN